MSTFGGKIKEIPNISVDRFDGENVESEAYFLSHCHSDHMVGLYQNVFQTNLVRNNKFLYASEISCIILRKMFPLIKDNVKELCLHTPNTVSLKSKNISVTPVPAGHCPGSVMFLFESDVHVLYTGDYRISKSDVKKPKAFYNAFNEVVTIGNLYLDTTFFLKSYSNFPSRAVSLRELCKIINEWVTKGENFIVKLNTSARYGFEYVFSEIYKTIGMPVHVSQDAFEFYSLIPELDKSVTTKSTATQIHSSCGETYMKICTYDARFKIRTIKLSALRWQQENLKNGLSSCDSNTHFVCYSTHASYEEGMELIKFLRPKEIEICVKHPDPYANKEIMDLIEESLQSLRIDENVVKTPKLFEIQSKSMGKVEAEEVVNDIFGILDSPPRSRKHEYEVDCNENVHDLSPCKKFK